MTKITPDHLAQSAHIYIRQSTADQVLHNHESRRRQYGLTERARQLGWQEVVVIPVRPLPERLGILWREAIRFIAVGTPIADTAGEFDFRARRIRSALMRR